MSARVDQEVVLVLTQPTSSNARVDQEVLLVVNKTPTFVFPTGQAIAASVGSVTVTVPGVDVAVTGNAITSSVGSVTVTTTVVITSRINQEVALVLTQPTSTKALVDQEVLLAVVQPAVAPTGSAIASSVGTVTVTIIQNVQVTLAGNSLAISRGTVGVVIPRPGPDRPSIQFHPVLKPLAFVSRPLLQAGKRASAEKNFVGFLTDPGAFKHFSLGGNIEIVKGKVMWYSMGGTITLGSSPGTLVITPFFGPSTDGVNLGQSSPQSYSASTNRIAWRLQGQIIVRDYSLAPGTSQVICNGNFTMNHHPSVVIVFGSPDAIYVDTSVKRPKMSGALNFAATFAPSRMNATSPFVRTAYAVLRIM